MTLFYGSVLLIGIAMAGYWLVRVAIANSVDGWERANPELKWGASGRMVIAAFIGFGLGGFAILYTDLNPILSVGSAVLGGVGLAAGARWFGPTTA